LSQAQIEYALQDVMHLPRLHEVLIQQLDTLGRSSWMDEEMRQWQASLVESEIQAPWRRLSGFASLSHRSMAVAAQLWSWRERSAEKRDVPPRRVLRDDLLIELARREMSKIHQIKMLRGMERRTHDRDLPEIAETIASALGSPKDQWPERPPREQAGPDLNMLGQFLYSAFSILCRDLRLAPSLVGTVQDVRKLAAWHLKIGQSDETPRLARGWRAAVVGTTIQEMLHGKWAITISKPLDDQPLSLLATKKNES
jgi:ribonuclease D